ncbi:MAG TPA: hypothetical protein PKW90_23790 [Myxococcota bacterium]|nr:hypothetical protein [Myxococcota bacterium]
MPAGTQVDVTFKYRVMGDPDPSGRPAIPVFFLQVNPDLAWAYSDPNPDLTDYPSKFWTDLAADMSIEVQDTFRLTVPTLSSAGDPALLIWFATNMTDPDLISYWYANVTISDIQLARVSQPRLSIRGHQSGVRFA